MLRFIILRKAFRNTFLFECAAVADTTTTSGLELRKLADVFCSFVFLLRRRRIHRLNYLAPAVSVSSEELKALGGHAAGRSCLAWIGEWYSCNGGEDALVKVWKVEGTSLGVDARDIECTNDREVNCIAPANDDGKTMIVAAEGGEVRHIVASGQLVSIVTRMALGCGYQRKRRWRVGSYSRRRWYYSRCASQRCCGIVYALWSLWSCKVDCVGAQRAAARASYGSDGTVKIWNVTNKAMVKSISCAPKDASPDFSPSALFGRLAWHPSGSCLAIPTPGGVRIVSTTSWEDVSVLKLDDEPISIASWSPNGRYVCASSRKVAGVWDVKDKVLIKRFASSGHVVARVGTRQKCDRGDR